MPQIQRHFPLLLIAMTLLFAFMMAFFPFQSEDLFMYLAIAREYFQTGALPKTDPFLFSIPHYEWQILHEWACYFFFYGIYKLAGLFGVTAIKALLICLTMALPLFWTRRTNAQILVWGITTVVVCCAVNFRFAERANLFSDILTTLVLTLCLVELRQPSRWKYALPLISIVWVQLHPGYMLGWAICLLFCLTQIKDWRTTHFRLFSLMTLLSILVCSLNPDGLQGMLYPIHFALHEGKVMQQFYYEWYPSFHAVFRDRWEILLILGLTIFYSGVLLSGFFTKNISRISHPIFTSRQKILFILAVHSFITLMAIKGIRFVPILGYSLIIIGCFWSEGKNLSPKWRPATLVLLLFVCGMICKVLTLGYTSMGVQRHFGSGIDPIAQPTTNLAVIEQAHFNAPLYNTHRFGSYLAWEWQGKRKVFYHGFVTDMDFYLQDYMGIARSQDDFTRIVNKYNLKGFLIERLVSSKPLIELIRYNPDWQLVSQDPASLLFIKKDVIRYE